MPEASFKQAFGWNEHLPKALVDREIVFYDLEKGVVEFECEVVRRVVEVKLASASHTANLANARAVLQRPANHNYY